MGPGLYFVALLPEHAQQALITDLKLHIKARYGASHALKLPPHITIVAPFRMPEAHETILENILKTFAHEKPPFKVRMKDFGAFRPRVIYISIEENKFLNALHFDLLERLSTVALIQKGDPQKAFHPHITLANRDLSKAQFDAAWPVFKTKKTQMEFDANALTLFKHNSQSWDIFNVFSFKS